MLFRDCFEKALIQTFSFDDELTSHCPVIEGFASSLFILSVTENAALKFILQVLKTGKPALAMDNSNIEKYVPSIDK